MKNGYRKTPMNHKTTFFNVEPGKLFIDVSHGYYGIYVVIGSEVIFDENVKHDIVRVWIMLSDGSISQYTGEIDERFLKDDEVMI